MFSLQVKEETKQYKEPMKHILYALQKLFKDELEWLQ